MMRIRYELRESESIRVCLKSTRLYEDKSAALGFSIRNDCVNRPEFLVFFFFCISILALLFY